MKHAIKKSLYTNNRDVTIKADRREERAISFLLSLSTLLDTLDLGIIKFET